MSRLIVFGTIFAMLAVAAGAAVTPAPIFTDNAVLQQGIEAPVWGTADNGEKVTVKFQNQEVSTVAKDGNWMVRLAPLKAGGPFTMTINDLTLKNILVGEVWICSGQSNMAWTVKNTTNGEKDILESRNSMIRLYTVPLKTSYTPLTEINSNWVMCGPTTTPGFSAVGYYFGRDIEKELQVPVGLINTSWGGTSVESWTSLDGFKAMPELANWVAEEYEKKAEGPNHPSVLFNAMVNPLVPYAFRGAIWYQGENNAGKAFAYRKLFPGMIKSWRDAWKQGDFPFLFVQLAPFMKIEDTPMESAWAELREAQLLTLKASPNTGMAVITDVGNPNDIHPRDKEPVGARLALAAQKIAYKQDIVYSGPIYRSMKRSGSTITLYFDNVGRGLESRGGELTGFAIAGEDKKFVWANAKVVGGNKVVVSADSVKEPVAVRYGWANCPVVNLWNKDGLPASPFRTDDFPMVTNK
ncbi:MAG: sialate O-acetylesterase [Armatimonadetes bacterium]|nr:sialate O-acetylesterase [Armatimonadota bacterium]